MAFMAHRSFAAPFVAVPYLAIPLMAASLAAAGIVAPAAAGAAPQVAAAAKSKRPKRPTQKRIYAGRHGAWVLTCFTTSDKRVLCNLGQVRRYPVPSKDLAKAGIKKKPILVLLVHGTSYGEAVLFISPIKWAKDSRLIGQVDHRKPFGLDTPEKLDKVPIDPRDSKGLIKQFMAGNILRVRFLPPVGDVQQLEFSLNGFTSAIKTMRAQIKKHTPPGTLKPSAAKTKK
jgi:hypothetical protein